MAKSPRHKDEHYYEALPGQMDLETWLAANPAPPPAPGGNGSPALDAPPAFADLERIGRTVFGNLWEGKLAEQISEDPRNMRRWRAGEGVPSARAVATARAWAVELAAQVLRAAGEPDLAEPQQAHLGRVHREARERGRAMMAASLSGPASVP